jgi:hypothetical protein
MKTDISNNTEGTKRVFVDMDWGSTGLWVPYDEDDHLANVSYESFGLPKELLERFYEWGKWYNDQLPGASDEENKMDRKLFESYGLAIAIDLKRFLGDSYRVFMGGYADHFEIVFVDRKYGGKVAVAIPKKEIKLAE